ncbi:MAG: hypothetical protein ACLTC3_12710 [Evtepia gabavorous]
MGAAQDHPEHHPEAGRSQGVSDPRPHRGKRRERQICLTAAGQAYARQVLRPIYGAEDAALQATLDRYGPAVVAALVEAVDYFGRCLRDSFAKQMEEKENDDNP